ncbi:hypothetical protein ILUMI_00794 [Ignelater luminosus]|uniref:Uncharacterized protein n=1 Tax=Ignelater luminosus TaxID=2038154 RepID=A0A8K0DL68_IGNLU|nr:hypothetical protein ILUMI_00794 [Ignelater luminosus]
MVKERVLIDHKQFNNFESVNDILENGSDKSVDSESSEELHYGPGIVNKLKNRYLSLTLRENNVKTRPSILPMRKATSLEHLLDDDVPNGKPPVANSRLFQSRCKENDTTRGVSNRYYNAAIRVGDLKRARSVETISRTDEHNTEPVENDVRRKHESLHEDMFIITEGNDKLSGKMYDNKTLEITTETRLFSSTVTHKINRPKRIAPIMSEKEKPPVDVVKQTKMIFEGRADQRTKPPHQTGEVAAKVATYKNIIGQTRNNKKPPILKQKPVVIAQDLGNRRPTNTSDNNKLPKPSKLPLGNSENGWITEDKSPSPDVASIPRSVPSPIPDISRISSSNREEPSNNNKSKNGTILSETPDLILHSSPIKNVSSPTFRILATDNFLKAEINHSNSNNFRIKLNSDTENKKQHIPGNFKPKAPSSPVTNEEEECKTVSPESRNRIQKAGNTMTYNLSNSAGSRSHLPVINKEINTNAKPVVVPQSGRNAHLINKPVIDKTAAESQLLSPVTKSPLLAQQPSLLTPQEIEKNNINTAKSLEQVAVSPVSAKSSVEEVKKVEVPKTSLLRETKEQNSIVFKFTDRKDVPDYVGNDGRIRTGKIEKPKVGEGGIILLPGATLDESLADDDDDWLLSLEGPPSPCDVVFINDNVLIDGRSSLSQKSKKAKMKIQFVDSGPDIFEYPSEASLMDDLSTSRESSPGHIVPTLSGSSLANYIPKSGSTEDFQLGITRSMPTSPVITEAKNDGAYLESTLDEVEEPVLFSAGTNSDILF